MASWTQNFYHAVFSTKNRVPWLSADIEARVHAFLGGIAKDLGCTPIAINGMPDHVHVLVRFPSVLSVADMLQNLKSRSSKWIHQTFADLGDFWWQDNYGGFTVSKTSVDAVELYIRNQKQHHQSMSFESEFLAMLRRTGWDGSPDEVLG